MSNVIEVVGLTRSYGRRRGIEDVTFAVSEGEVFGFLGPNGAGKTTTIRTLLGLIRPTAGRASIFGRDVWRDAPQVHGRLAFMGSEPGFLGEQTSAAQLDYLAQLRGLERGVWRPMAERLELDTSVPVRKLSRGNRQKIGLVALFMGHEPLLIMDEPTTGLDPLMQREFLALVADARADGRTIFLSSHNLTEVERTCGRVGIIREGRLVDISDVAALLGEHWRSVNLVLRSSAGTDVFQLPNVSVVAHTGREVHLMIQGDVNQLLGVIATLDVVDVAITTPDVEDLFLRYYHDEAEATSDTTRETVPV